MSLYLHNNQSSGKIPAEFGKLNSLARLYLDNNKLTNPLPSKLGELKDLQDLGLSGNRFTGGIPIEILLNFPELRRLTLRGNRFSGEIPAELGELQNLREIWLNDNQVSGSIPRELFEFRDLNTLYLSRNQLTGEVPDVDAENGDSASLYDLRLHCNNLSGALPSALGGLPELSEIWIYGNDFEMPLPDSFDDVTVYASGPPSTWPDEVCAQSSLASKPKPKFKPKPRWQPLLQVTLVGDAGPASLGDALEFRFSVSNAGNTELTAVFWGSPELGVDRRSIDGERLAPGESAVIEVRFGPVRPEHLPGPIMVRFFGDSNQTHAVWAAHSVPLHAPPPPPPESPAPVLIVERVRHLVPATDRTHNVPDLRSEPADGSARRCEFLTFYDATGGLSSWGFATSEVLSETPGVLSQYFQRGVLDC